MKNFILTMTLLVVAVAPVLADDITYCEGDVCYTDPATLQIGATVPPTGADPNLIDGNVVNVYQNQGGASLLGNPWLLIIGVPNTTSANPFGAGITSLTASAGGATSYTFLGLQGTMGSGQEAYSQLGVKGPTDSSNNFVNWSGADLTYAGVTATGYGLYEFAVSADIGAKQFVSFTFDDLPVGSIAIAYGQTSSTTTSGGKTKTNITIYDTPFTQAGLGKGVPEPSSLSLLGAGLLGIIALLRR